MNLAAFAMRRPVTMLMTIVALLGGGILALNQMRIDIFPSINAPQIYVVNNYAGMAPDQIEGIITNVYEQNFQYVDGLKEVESKNIQNFVLLKLTFYPGTNMAAATSQVVSLSNRARGQMPPSVLPPFVIRFDAASVPIGYLVLESKTRPLGELADLGLYRIRPLLISQIQGTVAFSPFGSNTRAIVITVDPDRLRAHNFSPEDIVTALDAGNVVVPAGNLYMRGEMPLVPTNAMVADPHKLGDIPVRPGQDVYIRDVATDRGHHRHQLRLRVGQRPEVDLYPGGQERHRLDADRGRGKFTIRCGCSSRWCPRTWTCVTSSTNRRRSARRSRASPPKARSAPSLTGLMILVFLHDLRTVIVVVVGIPLALDRRPGRPVGDRQHVEHHVAGRPGAVDRHPGGQAIVTVENTHVQMEHTGSVARAVRQSDASTVTSRLLALLCILSVFIPTFVMREPVRSLFMPLTVAVGFAMIAAFLMSSTVVPVLSVWLMRPRAESAGTKGLFDGCCPASSGSCPRPCGSAEWWCRRTWLFAACCSGWSARKSAGSCFPRSIRASS